MNRCGNCGTFSSGCPEQCPECGAFGMLLPFVERAKPQAASSGFSVDANAIGDEVARPIATGFPAWDEALSGGLVPGTSLVLYGKEGSRKTTWSGAIADRVAAAARSRALYLCPEMPSYQVRDAVLRVRRPLVCLSIVGNERDASNLDLCLAEIMRLRPLVVVYDSIQNFDALDARAGTDLAVKLTVLAARRAAARMQHCAILISQVNKQGLPTGPHRTIHDCDVVARVETRKVTVTKSRVGLGPCPRVARFA